MGGCGPATIRAIRSDGKEVGYGRGYGNRACDSGDLYNRPVRVLAKERR